jgi:hypothetical protein
MTLDTPMICVTDEALVGIHLPAIADPITYDASSVTPQERAYLDSVAAWSAAAGGIRLSSAPTSTATTARTLQPCTS